MKIKLKEAERLLELAWGVIANAGGGDWKKESPVWQEAARMWETEWHKYLEKDDNHLSRRIFPLQGIPASIPWEAAEHAYKTYSAYWGTNQTLQKLSERGGFSLPEFACLWSGHKPRHADYAHNDTNCIVKVVQLLIW